MLAQKINNYVSTAVAKQTKTMKKRPAIQNTFDVNFSAKVCSKEISPKHVKPSRAITIMSSQTNQEKSQISPDSMVAKAGPAAGGGGS